MRIGVHFRLRVVALVMLLLIGTMTWASCTGGEQYTPPPLPPGGGTWGAAPHPDLVISAIEVFPAQPQVGQYFTLNVYVGNEGQAASGEYDLAIYIKDISHGYTYPIGTFRQPGLQPEESIPVYTSQNQLVNDPGSYQVWVEIAPQGFEDGNDDNNMAGWSFTAK